MVISDQAEPGRAPVLLDERVNSVHLSTDHATMQFIERLGWAISDAEEAERVQVPRPTARAVGGRSGGSLGGHSQARSPFVAGNGGSATGEVGRRARTPSSLKK
jgi:hypothetical protein